MRPSFVALRQHNFRLLTAGNLVSVTGTWMQVLGVNWLVLTLTGSPTQMGVAVMVQALPVILLSPYGGALADRLPARPLLAVTQALHIVLSLGLAYVAASGHGGIRAVYAIVLLSGVISAVDGPAMGRFGSTVVAPEHLGNALALGSIVNSAGRVLGMSLGGVVVAAFGPAPLFVVNAASFAAVLIGLAALRTDALVTLEPATVEETAMRAVRQGLRCVLIQPTLLITFVLAIVLGSLGRNYQVTMAAMSAGPLDAGAGGYGILSTAFSVGAVAGAVLVTARQDLSYEFLIGVGFAGSVLQAVSGFMPNLTTFALTMVLVAATSVVIDTVVSTRVQLDTREAMRGRVLSLLAANGSLAGALGAPVLGWLCEVIGPRLCLVAAGIVCALACVGAWLAIRRAEPAVSYRGEPVPECVADHLAPAADGVLGADPVSGPTARAMGELVAAR